MDPLVATLESVPIVMEEPQPIPEAQTAPVSPVNKVLALPELLANIFGHLAADSDLESLKNVRLVCKLWKKAAFSTFKKHPSLRPWIVADWNTLWASRYSFMCLAKTLMCLKSQEVSSLESTVMCLFKTLKPLGDLTSLEKCVDKLVPGSGFPLKLIINEWSPNVATFLRDFSCDIVSVVIFWPFVDRSYFDEFEGELKGIELPVLEEASIAGFNIWECKDGTADSGGFVKGLTMWKQLVSVSDCDKLKSRNVQLRTSYLDDTRHPLLPSNPALNLIEWSKVNSLGCTHDIFVSLSNSHKLSALRKLTIYSLVPDTHPDVAEWNALSLENVAYLKELTLEADVNWELNHPMENLTSLKLRGRLTITASQPVFTLLPSLKKVELTERMKYLTIDPVSHLTSGGGGFINVVQLKLKEVWTNYDWQESGSTEISEFFPNLKTIEWECLRSFTKLRVSFSRMEFLTRLKVKTKIEWDFNVVLLLTGVLERDIPEDEDVWPTALVNNPHSITNLRHLKYLHVSPYDWPLQCTIPEDDERGIIVSARNSRFLFTAAFRTMETLEHLHFHRIVMDASCAAQWEQMGRKITHTFNED